MMMTGTACRYLIFLLWMGYVFVCCLFLFTGGFLLRRQVLDNQSECLAREPCNPHAPPLFGKAVVLLIDAFKYEFALHNESLSRPMAFQNQVPIISQLQKSGRGKLYEFMADPPTTTMQRLKGLTTGSLPTFIDASSNFGTEEVTDDNIIQQLNLQQKRVVFAGDDTWSGLFPRGFRRSYPFPSFDVWDLDTVDRGVNVHLFQELQRGPAQEWDVLIGHYLGVDHVGHKHGPFHPEMKRKLGEMNEVIEKVAQQLDNETVLFVMGDHGMTASGDHGGDSPDELSAALFVYSPRWKFDDPVTTRHHHAVVEQVDFVPTFSLLMGIPIPFSNLGKLIPDLFGSVDHLVPYIQSNVKQVMHFLEGYRAYGGNLPNHLHDNMRNRYESFEELSSQVDRSHIVRNGLDILRNAKAMCQSVWAEFNLAVMGLGLILFLMQLCLILLLALTPKAHVLSGILNIGFVTHLWISSIIGAGLGVLFPLSQYIRPEKGLEFVLFASSSFSVMAFGFNLLWKLIDSASDMMSHLYRSITAKSLLCIGFIFIQFETVFANSFVVFEAEIFAFLVGSLFLGFLLDLRSSKKIQSNQPEGEVDSEKKEPNFTVGRTRILVILLIIGAVKACSIYFRCREEQLGYCFPTEFHKPMGTLPKDPAYRDYKNRRFCSTVVTVVLAVIVPHFWLNSCGNLNGFSLPVCVASYVPPICGISIVFYWAIQGHDVGSKLVPWQQNILAQVALALCLLALVVLIVQPRLVYKMDRGSGQEFVSQPSSNGVQGYFKMISSNWKDHFTVDSAAGRKKISVFGLGTAFSAPLVVVHTLLSLLSMLLLGDGLSPSLGLAFVITYVFHMLDGANRLLTLDRLDQVFTVPWTSLIGHWAIESLFFYASGHQPTFPSIQWNAAFVGFSGSNYGKETVTGFLMPVLMIGWNTFCSRILFGVFLPFLVISPFTLWLVFPRLRSQFKAVAVAGKVLETEDLDQGELVLVEFSEETTSSVFKVCAKYIWLQAFRLFSTMLAATVLRRHLMVWKIFAPRFIFEAVGFLVSLVSVVVGFCIFGRIQQSLIRYYRMLQKNK